MRLEGIEFVYLNGRMTTNQKIKAVKAFHENKDVKYMVSAETGETEIHSLYGLSNDMF